MTDKKRYRYTGYGLKVLSEIEFPELMPDDFEQADITITLGVIPADMRAKVNPDKSSSAVLQQDFILNIPSVGLYYASQGKNILVEPNENSDESSLRLFLLSNALAAILVQRNQILLHASSIIHENQLILFLGDSGAGKSSIAAELSKRGFTVFSDDVCVLKSFHKNDKTVEAIASYPMMKLWDDTINVLKDDQFEKKHKIRPEMEKYSHFFHSSFDSKAYPIKKLFFLHPVNEIIPYESRKVSGLEAFEWLGKNTYRRQFILDHEMQKLHLEAISRLISSAEILLMSRSMSDSDISSFTDFVEKYL